MTGVHSARPPPPGESNPVTFAVAPTLARVAGRITNSEALVEGSVRLYWYRLYRSIRLMTLFA